MLQPWPWSYEYHVISNTQYYPRSRFICPDYVGVSLFLWLMNNCYEYCVQTPVSIIYKYVNSSDVIMYNIYVLKFRDTLHYNYVYMFK